VMMSILEESRHLVQKQNRQQSYWSIAAYCVPIFKIVQSS